MPLCTLPVCLKPICRVHEQHPFYINHLLGCSTCPSLPLLSPTVEVSLHPSNPKRQCTQSTLRLQTNIYHVSDMYHVSVEYRTCDQEVVGSSLGLARGVKTPGMFLTPMCLCSPSSTSWYRPKGGDDALRLGYGLCDPLVTHGHI